MRPTWFRLKAGAVSLALTLAAVFGFAVPASAALTYFYAGVHQSVTSGTLPNGICANFTVATPTLTSGDFHTLAEIDAEKTIGGSVQTVEVGWTVDAVGGSPKIFVGRWVNGVFGGYNSGGWNDNAGNATNAGSTLSNGSTRFCVQYDGTATPAGWWIWQGTTAGVGDWLGVYPATVWTGAGVSGYTDASYLQAFGEVAANVSSPTTQMGNGLCGGSNTSAATIGSILFPNLPTTSVNMTATTVTDSTKYSVASLSARTMRYGGDGSCP